MEQVIKYNMVNRPVKIIEIKDKNWRAGLSLQKGQAFGGLFYNLQNCNPFENIGVAQPSYAALTVAVATSASVLTAFNISSTSYVLVHSDTKLKKVLAASPYTITDVSSSVDVTARVMGGIVFGGKYVYANEGGGGRQVRVWDGAASDVQILNGFGGANGMASFCMGPDGNLYVSSFTGYFSQITSLAGTAGNTNVFKTIDAGFTVRKILNDGRYLVLIADDNAFVPGSRTVGNFRCKVYFWDLIKTQDYGGFGAGNTILPEIVWDSSHFVGESYFVGAEIRDGMIYAFGQSGLWAFNAATAPKMIRPFIGSANLTIQQVPTSPYQISQALGSIFWGDANAVSGQKIFAYGNPVAGQQPIFYQPYSEASLQCTALLAVGTLVFSATADGNLFVHNDTSQARNDVTAQPVISRFEEPMRFEYVKVVLTAPLSSGQTVTCGFLSGNAGISSNEARTYNASKPSQTFVFRRSPSSNTNERFEEGYPVVTGGKCAIQRIAVYGTPLSDSSEDI